MPCDSRDGRVVERDFERDGRLHIHFIIDPVGGLPTGQYCAIFKFADGETEQVCVSGERDVADSAYFHSGGFPATEMDGPVLVDDGQLLQKPGQRLLAAAAHIERLHPLDCFTCLRGYSPNLVEPAALASVLESVAIGENGNSENSTGCPLSRIVRS